MKMYKTITALGLSACMIIGLASCGNESKKAESGSGSISVKDAEQHSTTEESAKQQTVTKFQLSSMENVIGALVSYMHDNDVDTLLTKDAENDSQITQEYLLNYVNTASENDTRSYKAVLPDADTDTEYYKEQESSIRNLLISGLGKDLTNQLESTESIYYLDNAYYIEAMDCDDIQVKYIGKGGKKQFTNKKKFTYKYSLTDEDGNVSKGKLKVCFTYEPESEDGIAVRKIVVNEEFSENNSTEIDADDAYNENEDAQAYKQISMTNAEQKVREQFGSDYDYILDSVEDIDDKRYYVYKQTMTEENEDAQAHKKALKYIFVSVDGSEIYTGSADDDGYYIDYK